MQIWLVLAKVPKALWDICNTEAHAPPAPSVPGYCRLMLLSKIESLYEKENKVLAIDHHYFSTPLEEMADLSNTQLNQYITFFAPLISQSVKKAAEMDPNFRPIEAYFPLLLSHDNSNWDNNHV